MAPRKNQRKNNKSDTAAGDDERLLFRRAMADATPLQADTVEPPRRRTRAVARFSRQDERQVLRESLETPPHVIETENGTALSYRHPSVNPKAMRRLARGGVSVQDEVDLHGLTAAQAKEVLTDFIEHAMRSGYTCIRIIHGKGLRSGHNGPVLKQRVDQWLRRWDPVLAFVSARQSDGGTGAVYVLLKKGP
ncbi:MAG: Smr/MutS family protein [Woeseia sp.]